MAYYNSLTEYMHALPRGSGFTNFMNVRIDIVTKQNISLMRVGESMKWDNVHDEV